MLKNYFKIAYRSLLKNKGFATINILGLSIGIAACILISVYILHESSYDKHITNSENIYRMTNSYNQEGVVEWDIHFSANTAPTVKEDFDEVLESGRLMDNALFYGAGSNEIRIEGEQMQHHEDGFSYADQSILDMMEIPMVFGDRATALAEPNTIVISNKISQKHFRNVDPVGKVIYLNGNNDDPFTIGGVMEDFPSNSHLSYDFFLTMTDVEFGEGEQTRWVQNNYATYVALRPRTEVKQFEKRMKTALVVNYIKPALKDAGYAMYETIEEKAGLELRPMTDINLYSADITFESSYRNDIKIIWMFGLVALFILIIASINFVNLTTAKSANRAKEVGLRKVVGSRRINLIGQFLVESVLISLIAFGVGIGLSYLFLPYFRDISGIALEIPMQNPIFLSAILATSVGVGLLAGLYPAFYLSKFKPINVLKGKISMGSKSGGLRSSLVVFQFAISTILITGTLIINNQMDFILNSKVGFDKNQVVQIYGTNMLGDQVQTFKDEIKNLAGVSNASISDYLPIEGTKRNGNSFVNEGGENIDQAVFGQAWEIDEDYIETMGINLLEGRNFSSDRGTENLTTIINQTMVEKLGLVDPIGKKISRYGTIYEIIGVVENFNFNTMKEKVQALCFFYNISPSIVSVKTNTADMSNLLATIESKWSSMAPNLAFRYEFMDASFSRMYDNVTRMKSIFTIFAILAILVACLGLFALSAYMVEQRNKEMSIRKVLGASLQNIFVLLTKNFIALILISLVISIPIALYIMKNWLQDYEYRIDITWHVFAIAAVAALLIAVSTISFHSIRAALVNPVKSLRSE